LCSAYAPELLARFVKARQSQTLANFLGQLLPQVHEATLDDLVYPTEIVGKRVRYRLDGSKLLKVRLCSPAAAAPTASSSLVRAAGEARMTGRVGAQPAACSTCSSLFSWPPEFSASGALVPLNWAALCTVLYFLAPLGQQQCCGGLKV